MKTRQAPRCAGLQVNTIGRARGTALLALVLGTLAGERASNARDSTPVEAPSETPARAAEPTPPKAGAAPIPGLSAEDAAWLRSLLEGVGAADASPRLMARSPERQTRIMYELASTDLQSARAMYCAAGDAVLDRYDPAKSRDVNLSQMQAELVAQLPRARAMGCLDHVANDDVVAIDVDASVVDEARHATLVENARRAVKDGRIAGFRHPPDHRGAFHFEFTKGTPSSATAPTENQPQRTEPPKTEPPKTEPPKTERSE